MKTLDEKIKEVVKRVQDDEFDYLGYDYEGNTRVL